MKIISSIQFPLKLLFSFSFALLFYNRVSHYQESYIKFALLPLVSKYHLVNSFYFFGFLELVMMCLVFFLPRKPVKLAIDMALFLYVPWLIIYFMILYQTSNGCIECNYTTHLLGENLTITAAALVLLSALYLFVLRDAQGKTTQRLNA
jgi:FtsH-binding integral membrane protein